MTTCTERWPEARSGEYNPACCRFPKSCSAEPTPEPTAAEGDVIERAARTMYLAYRDDPESVEWAHAAWRLTPHVREEYLRCARALHAAGLLREED